MERDRLPIYDLESDIVARLREGRRLVLCAPTGSGKSTQVPQILLRHGLLEKGQAVILQPRRIAARLLAARVAQEMGVELGAEVGYQVRFENVTGPKTRIRFVTEGLLLRQMISDPRLGGVSALLFDEFHERHLYGDLTLAQALDLQERERPDLLILVMSATLDGERLEAYLKPCARLSSEGRQHPVRIDYAGASPAPPWEQAADAVAGWIRGGGQGDALVFMPGAFEIAQTLEALRTREECRGRPLLPLHGELPPQEQDAAVAPHDRPRVIVATNVAETSLTIEGVRLVVDSGLARLPRHDAWRSLNTLFIEKISRASADQRAGRAGRTAPGDCIRLWDRKEHEKRPAREEPEVLRLDLAEAVLTLKAAGAGDLRKFRWLDAPDEKSLARSEELLLDLGALQAPADITPLGRRMLAFPIHPRYSRMLLAASDLGCVRQAALAAALTQGRDILVRRPDSGAAEFRDDVLGDRDTSDFWILMRAWEFAAENRFRLEACRRAGIHAQSARQAGPAFDLFLGIARREGLDTADRDAPEEALRKCLLIGFPDRVARRIDAGTLRCELVHGRRGVLARESAVRRATLFVAAEVREVEGKDRGLSTILSLATAVEARWLEELFPGDVTRRVNVRYDAESKRVVADTKVRFHDLLFATEPAEPPADEAARLLAEEVLAGRLALRDWDAAVEQWILRVNFLSRACPELEIGAIGPEDRRLLIEQVCAGATSHKDIKDRPVAGVVRGWLDAGRRELVEKHAPERLALSNGRKPKVVYEADAAPHVALRIQELYDVTRIPPVAMGRVTPLLHILAPSMRPVQITHDLAGFWREHYPKLRKELQRKYPRHEWR